jgi:hypothetical protein
MGLRGEPGIAAECSSQCGQQPLQPFPPIQPPMVMRHNEFLKN